MITKYTFLITVPGVVIFGEVKNWGELRLEKLSLCKLEQITILKIGDGSAWKPGLLNLLKLGSLQLL